MDLCPTCGKKLEKSKWGPSMVCENGHGWTLKALEAAEPYSTPTPPKKATPPKK